MGSLLVVTDSPGAGKSTVSRLIADGFESGLLVEGDTFFSFLASGAISEARSVDRVRRRVGHGFTDVDAARSMHRQFDTDRPAFGPAIEGDHLDATATVDEAMQRCATGELRVRSADL